MRPAPRRSHARTRGATVGSKVPSVRSDQAKTSRSAAKSSASSALSSPGVAIQARERTAAPGRQERLDARSSSTTGSEAVEPRFAARRRRSATSAVVPMRPRGARRAARMARGAAATRGPRPQAGDGAPRACGSSPVPASPRLVQIEIEIQSQSQR